MLFIYFATLMSSSWNAIQVEEPGNNLEFELILFDMIAVVEEQVT